MTDYYVYLFKATWLQSLSLLILCLFVLSRILWKGRKIVKVKGRRPKVLFFLKSIGWIGIITVYFYMFYLVEPDWFTRPEWIQGEIMNKMITEESFHSYKIEVQSQNGKKILYIDESTYPELSIGQKVKLSFCPNRLEVVTCEIL